jgi:SnoaL-like protein
MEAEAFQAWLGAYGRAWMGRDARSAGDLFAEDGTYQITPFEEPVRGRAAIIAYWRRVAETEREIVFGYEVLSVTVDVGIARWWASFLIVPERLQTRLDGIFVVSFDEDGRCKALREWWHKEQSRAD